MFVQRYKQKTEIEREREEKKTSPSNRATRAKRVQCRCVLLFEAATILSIFLGVLFSGAPFPQSSVWLRHITVMSPRRALSLFRRRAGSSGRRDAWTRDYSVCDRSFLFFSNRPEKKKRMNHPVLIFVRTFISFIPSNHFTIVNWTCSIMNTVFQIFIVNIQKFNLKFLL